MIRLLRNYGATKRANQAIHSDGKTLHTKYEALGPPSIPNSSEGENRSQNQFPRRRLNFKTHSILIILRIYLLIMLFLLAFSLLAGLHNRTSTP